MINFSGDPVFDYFVTIGVFAALGLIPIFGAISLLKD